MVRYTVERGSVVDVRRLAGTRYATAAPTICTILPFCLRDLVLLPFSKQKQREKPIYRVKFFTQVGVGPSRLDS